MDHRHIHTKNWIKELQGYGVEAGPNGEALEDLDYYDLRFLVVREQMHRNLEQIPSPWFP